MLRQLLAAGQLLTQHQSHGAQHAAAWGAASCGKAWSATAAGNRPYHVCQLASRGVISVRGDDAVQFMQVTVVMCKCLQHETLVGAGQCCTAGIAAHRIAAVLLRV